QGSMELEPSSSASHAGETWVLSCGCICSIYARASSRVWAINFRLFVSRCVLLIRRGPSGLTKSVSHAGPMMQPANAELKTPTGVGCSALTSSFSLQLSVRKLLSDRFLHSRLAIVCHRFGLWQRTSVTNARQKKNALLATQYTNVLCEVSSLQPLLGERGELLLNASRHTTVEKPLTNLGRRVQCAIWVVSGQLDHALLDVR